MAFNACKEYGHWQLTNARADAAEDMKKTTWSGGIKQSQNFKTTAMAYVLPFHSCLQLQFSERTHKI